MIRGDRAGATRRAQRVRDGVTSINDVLDTLVEIQERQDWMALDYKSWSEYYEGEFGPDKLKLTQEERGRVIGALVAAGIPKRQLAKMLGVSEGTVRNDAKRSKVRNNYAPPAIEPQVNESEPVENATAEPDPADIPAAMTQLLTETAAASVGAGVRMPAARPAESPCSDAPDRAHCAAADCGADLSGNEQAAGHLRCRSCDPLTLHKANGIGVEEGYGECDECAIQARIADRTSAASVAAANTEDASPALGEPDVDELAASTSGTLHEQENGWSGPNGDCGVSCTCGVMFDGFDTIGEALALLDLHIANPEERIEEEAVEGSDVDLSSFDAAYLSADDLAALDSPAADPIEPSHAGVPAAGGYPESLDDLGCPLCEYVVEVSEEDPDASLSEMYNHIWRQCATGEGDERRRSAYDLLARVRTISPAADTSDTESQVVLQQSGSDSPAGREGGRSETDFPVGPDHPVATAVLPGIDHHLHGDEGGVAPEVRASVEPVLEGGGLAPDPSSSSDPEPHPGDRLLHALGVLVHLIDELDPEALGPYLFPGEVELLHLHADRIAEFVGRVGLARTQLAGNP